MSDLITKLETKEATIGIMGLGYVGLPLAIEFVNKAMKVIGFDVDQNKIKSLLNKRSYISDISNELISKMIEGQNFIPSNNFEMIKLCDVVCICVPTPLNENKEPDLTFILSAIGQVQKHRRKDQLIVLESTTYPGTTKEVVLPMLETTEYKVGINYFLAFSPERIDPGNKSFGVQNTPKIVGGITKSCTMASQRLYHLVVNNVFEVSSASSAEMVKILENSFRAINIGFVNEMAIICEKLGIDVWEVIQAASTKPFGYMPFFPSAGIGGHCIPIDPLYLSWKMKQLNYKTRFIDVADDINSHMPNYVVHRLSILLNSECKSLKKSKILILGVTYKKDIDDYRESPSIEVIKLLQDMGSLVDFYDPYVTKVLLRHNDGNSVKQRIEFDSYATLRDFDCVVLLTDHSCFEVEEIICNSKLILDTRDFLQKTTLMSLGNSFYSHTNLHKL
jgi:UDP-N-acetyl-D-glucosamine dehydrogenase